MPKSAYDVAVLEPQCLLNLTPRFRELRILPEDANQRDIDESRILMEQAFERAVQAANKEYGTDANVEFERFVPDEVAKSGRGGAVQGVWEIARLVIDSGVPAGVLSGFITHVLVQYGRELASGLVLADTLHDSSRNAPLRRYTEDGIVAYCEQHAKRLYPGLQLRSARVLERPSKTSVSNEPFVVSVGLGEKELLYTIGPDGDPHSIVEIRQGETRSVSTDEWHKWYLQINL